MKKQIFPHTVTDPKVRFGKPTVILTSAKSQRKKN